MIEIVSTALGATIGALVAVPATFWFAKASSTTEHKKNSEGFNALLENQYLRGKIAGACEELGKFDVRYSVVTVEHDNFLKSTFDAGYEMQLFYSGLPVGEATRRITHHGEKSKDENVMKIVGVVEKILETLANNAGKYNIPVTVTKSVQRAKK